jgi:hypothetical protein
MKYFAIIGIILGVSVFTACDDDNSQNDNLTNDVVNTVQDGTWRITLFNDSGKDETYHFTGYSFIFQSNGTVTATKSSSSVSGTWSVTSGSSSSKFNLNFGPDDPFEELNDDWDILENSSSEIRLKDVSGGDGTTDLLTFVKN